MSRQINQPINQVKLTNVAVVRYNYKGRRFEIACYRNKVLDFRSGLETDLSEVLQSERVFTNVSKGQFANASDLQKAFGTTDEEKIAKVILEKGNSVQVSDLERNQIYENALSQIATWIAANCIHPDSGRPYTSSQIRHVLGKNFQVQPHKPIKKQCLDAVKFLKKEIPIERAKMELSIQYPLPEASKVTEVLQGMSHQIIAEKCSTADANPITTVIQVDPSLYREINEMAKSVGGRLEILQQVVSQVGDIDLEQEIERKQHQNQGEIGGNALGGVEQEEDHEEEEELMKRLEHVRLRAAGNVNSESEEDSADDNVTKARNRKNQRKEMKKIKKAKRRETEEADESNARQGAKHASEGERQEVYKSSDMAMANASTQSEGEGKRCNTCGGSFNAAAEYRAHFRSDWHRFNQKLKLKGIQPVSEQEFLLCDADTFFGDSED